MYIEQLDVDDGEVVDDVGGVGAGDDVANNPHWMAVECLQIVAVGFSSFVGWKTNEQPSYCVPHTFICELI
jgi:hypothetical protein